MAVDSSVTAPNGTAPAASTASAGSGSDDTNPLVDFSIAAAPDDPDLWDGVTFKQKSGDGPTYMLPPTGTGKVDIKAPWKVKLDSKGGAGKAKPRTSKTGGEPTKVSIKITAGPVAWPWILAAARKITPGSGPWVIGHPQADLVEVHEVEIEEWKSAPTFDDHGQIVWEIDCKEIKASAQSGKGGGSATDTPGSADGQRWKDSPAKNAGKTNPNKGAFEEQQTKAAQP